MSQSDTPWCNTTTHLSHLLQMSYKDVEKKQIINSLFILNSCTAARHVHKWHWLICFPLDNSTTMTKAMEDWVNEKITAIPSFFLFIFWSHCTLMMTIMKQDERSKVRKVPLKSRLMTNNKLHNSSGVLSLCQSLANFSEPGYNKFLSTHEWLKFILPKGVISKSNEMVICPLRRKIDSFIDCIYSWNLEARE